MLKPEQISVEVVERRDDPGVWSVETINTDGSIEVALFPGPNSKDRATEYAAWRYGLAESAENIRLSAENERLRSFETANRLNAAQVAAQRARVEELEAEVSWHKENSARRGEAEAVVLRRVKELEEAGSALIADVRRRYPGEELRCQYMRALDALLPSKSGKKKKEPTND